MRQIRKAAVAIGVAGTLSVGTLVAVPAIAGSDGGPVDAPAQYEQVIDDADEAAPNPICTGNPERSRDRGQDHAHLRMHRQDRDCAGAQRHHHEGRAIGKGPGPSHRWGSRSGPGAGVGECPYVPAD